MDLNEFERSVGSPAPVYLVAAAQDYIRNRVIEICRNQVEESARVFDWSVFDLAKDAPADLLEVARTMPWLARRRWICARNAGQAEAALTEYVKRPSSRTVLVLEIEKVPSAWTELPVIRDLEHSDNVRWVMGLAREKGCEMLLAAAQLLVEAVGDDQQLLESETEKLCLWQWETRVITEDSVRRMAVQARNYEVFALGDAMAAGKPDKALRILSRLYDTGMAAPLIIATLYSNFRRLLAAHEMLERGRSFQEIVRELNLWSYRGRERTVRQFRRRALVGILTQLHEADRLCKTTSTDDKRHLERTVVDTCRLTSV